MNLIEQLETEEIKRLNKDIPDFSSGDTVVVNVKVVEGERSRIQAYEGVVIAKRNRGLNSAFTVRKISNGEGSSSRGSISSLLTSSSIISLHRSTHSLQI